MEARREAVRAAFALDEDRVPLVEPQYKIAPTPHVAVVRELPGAKRECVLRWGLIRSWAADPAIGNRLINARGTRVPG
jgi:putative SOS response-associated peptidase YedK